MKKFVIIKPNCRELANHLWNYLSVYAYGLETRAHIQNPSFVEWHRYFNLSEKESLITRMIARTPFFHQVWKMACVLYGSYLVRFCARCVRLTLGITTYLPPTRALASENGCETTYFIGWHFRNPIGLGKYRDALTTAFTPTESVLKKIEDVLKPFREKQLIGVHMRQQPYKGFEDGSFLVSRERVDTIIAEYLRENRLDAKDVELITVSDKYDVTSLFLLSKCDVVIGDNSTFSNLAAWFGDVPHIVATNEPVDWEYYKNRSEYFENKYATFAQ
jgi:hypothetical protein